LSPMDRDLALLAVGFLSAAGLALIQRHWSARDRRAKTEREALDLTVQVVMAWKDRALARLSGGDPTDAEKRLAKLDPEWRVDPRLIPDHEATRLLLRHCKEIELAPQSVRDKAGIAEFNLILVLAEQVRDSAKKRARELS
jgi:hypothetical protein